MVENPQNKCFSLQDLLNQLSSLSPEQLAFPIMYFDTEVEEFYDCIYTVEVNEPNQQPYFLVEF